MKMNLKNKHFRLIPAAVVILAMAFSASAEEIHRGLVSYWPLDVVEGMTTPDLGFGNPLTLNAMDDTNLVSGHNGQAMNFDGVEEFLSITHDGSNGLPISEGLNFSISLWVRGVGAGLNDRRVFSESSTTNTSPLFNLGTANDGASGSLDVYIRRDDGSVPVNHLKTTAEPFDGSWRHILYVMENGTARMYIDGIADPLELNYVHATFTPDTLSIGAILRATSCCWFQGDIDDVIVWERALTAEEATVLFAEGLPMPIEDFPPTIGVPPQSITADFGDYVTFSVEAYGQRPFTYQWLKGGNPIAGATGATLDISGIQLSDAGFYSVTVTNPIGSATSEEARLIVREDPEPDVSSGLISYWPFDEVVDEGDGTYTTPDTYSGNDMLLNLMDDSSLVASPNNQALEFNGFDQYASRQGGFPVAGGEAYSISLWVKGDGVLQDDLRIFAEGSSTTNTPLFGIGTDNPGESGLARVFVRSDDNAANVRTSSSVVFDDTWHHLVYVDNNGDANLYVDGVQDPTDFSYARGTLTLDQTSVGAILRAAPSHWFFGQIDEVAVWNRSITFTEIQDIYSEGIPEPTAPIPAQITVQPVGAELWAGSQVALSVQAVGTNPVTFQWYKDDVEIPGATGSTLNFFEASAADSGVYYAVATNAVGSDQSESAVLNVKKINDVTTGLVAYYPLDEADGTTTPDMINGYDMTLVNMDASNLVPGMSGQAMTFDGVEELLVRFPEEGEGLPIYQHPQFTVCMWVNGPGDQPDRRAFSEGSTTSQSPLYNIGTDNGGVGGVLDLFIRNDTDMGTPVNHLKSTNIAYDSTWHHVAVVDDAGMVSIYIDGVLDGTSISYTRGMLTANTTSIGGIQRAVASHWLTGTIDEVILWERPLSGSEIAHVMMNGPVPQPRQISITDMAMLPGGDLELTIETMNPSAEHMLKQATSLEAWDWADVPGATLSDPVGNVITATIPAPAAQSQVYRVVSLPPPPLFFDDCEGGDLGWTHGGAEDNWELGVPTTGPGSALSPVNVWATGLNDPYEVGTEAWLRSPIIDLTGVSRAQLKFWEYRDVEPLFQGLAFDYTTLRVLDADNLGGDPLATLIQQDVGTTPDWTRRTFQLTTPVVGKRIILEFTLTSDGYEEFPQFGWYLDDIEITEE